MDALLNYRPFRLFVVALGVPLLLLVAVVAASFPLFLLFPSAPTRHVTCGSQLKQIAYGCHLYASDWNEAFPPDLHTLLKEDYVGDMRVFFCPERGRGRKPGKPKRTPADRTPDHLMSYCYASGLTAADPPGYVLAFDEEWNHGGEGVNVLLIRGSVEWRTGIGSVHEQVRNQASSLAAQGRPVRIIRPSWSPYSESLDYRRRSSVWSLFRQIIAVVGLIVVFAAFAAPLYWLVRWGFRRV